MRASLEMIGFVGLAVAAHLAVWSPEAELGHQGAGAQGDALLSVRPSNAAVAQMVRQWETPPEIMTPDQPLAAAAPPAPDRPAAPPVPATDRPVNTAPVVALPDMARRPEAPALPSYQAPPEPEAPARETTPDDPVEQPAETEPQEAAPVASLRPTARPERAEAATRPEPPAQPEKAQPPKKQQASQPAASTSARRAQGSGGDSARGDGQKARTATVSQSRKSSLLSQWGGQIRARIARNAPRGVGQGTAVVRISVSANGTLLAAALARSSGNPRVDQLALAAVRQAGRFPPAPRELGQSQHAFMLPIKSK